MKIKVVKLGGSILLNKNSLNQMINLLKFYKNPVIVVSAFNGITNLLVELNIDIEKYFTPAQPQINEIEKFHLELIDSIFDSVDKKRAIYIKVMNRLKELREVVSGICLIKELSIGSKNKILSFGERLSSLILSEYLISKNFDSEEKLPEQIGLFGKSLSDYTAIDFKKSKKNVNEQLKGEKFYVVPGFYCLSPCEKISILGRGGSDYTATSIANLIDAQCVDFWKDCNGFQTADPKIVVNSSQIATLSYEEAAELAYFGAKIFHPSTIEPLVEKSIPLNLYNPQNFTDLDTPLTIISPKIDIHRKIIKSVTFTEDIGVIKLSSSDIGAIPGIIANLANILTSENINIKSIITSQTSINLLLNLSVLEKAFKTISNQCENKINNITFNKNLALIAAVGQGVLEKYGVAHKLFSAVSKVGVNIQIISAGASSTAVYFIVNKEDKDKTIQAIHEEFFQ